MRIDRFRNIVTSRGSDCTASKEPDHLGYCERDVVDAALEWRVTEACLKVEGHVVDRNIRCHVVPKQIEGSPENSPASRVAYRNRRVLARMPLPDAEDYHEKSEANE